MKFGAYLAALNHDAPQQWRDKFLRYKELKKALKRCRAADGSTEEARSAAASAEDAFFATLKEQLEEANKHFEEGAADVMESYRRLQRRWRLLRLVPCLCTPPPQEVAALAQRAYWCVRFARANAVALRKILKKHDKLCGNARGRAFLQECWRSLPASGGGLGFLHSPMLDELRAVQDALREQLHTTLGQDDDADSIARPPPPNAKKGEGSVRSVRSVLAHDSALSPPPAEVPAMPPANPAAPAASSVSPPLAAAALAAPAGACEPAAALLPDPGPEQEQEPGARLASWLESHSQSELGAPPGPDPASPHWTSELPPAGPALAAARARHRSAMAAAARGAASQPGSDAACLPLPPLLATTSMTSSTGGGTGALWEHASSLAESAEWTDHSGGAYGYTTPSAQRQWRRGLKAIAESPDCLLDSSDIDWADSEAVAAATTDIFPMPLPLPPPPIRTSIDSEGGSASARTASDAQPPAPAAQPPPVPAAPAGGSAAAAASAQRGLGGATAPPQGASPTGGSPRMRLVEEELRCPICLDLLYKPVGLGCGHKFCKACALEAAGFGGVLGATRNIRSHIPRRAACPQCRQPGVYRAMLRLRETGRLIQSRYPAEWAARHEDECKREAQMATRYVHALPAARLYAFF